MAHEVQGIEYCSGFLLPGMEPDNLAVQRWSGAEIPPEICKAIAREEIRNLVGAYGWASRRGAYGCEVTVRQEPQTGRSGGEEWLSGDHGPALTPSIGTATKLG